MTVNVAKMVKGCAVFGCGVLTLLSLVAPALPDQLKVSRVVDGDTVKVRSQTGELTIRLVGMQYRSINRIVPVKL